VAQSLAENDGVALDLHATGVDSGAVFGAFGAGEPSFALMVCYNESLARTEGSGE
jgi:hypothetical protein